METKSRLAIFSSTVLAVCTIIGIVMFALYTPYIPVQVETGLYLGRPRDEDWIAPINSGMSAVEMFMVGVENINQNSPFFAEEQLGTVYGQIRFMGLTLNFTNVLGATNIRDGENAFYRIFTFGNNPNSPFAADKDHAYYEHALVYNGGFYHQISAPIRNRNPHGATRPDFGPPLVVHQPDVWTSSNLGVTLQEFLEISATMPGEISMHNLSSETLTQAEDTSLEYVSACNCGGVFNSATGEYDTSGCEIGGFYRYNLVLCMDYGVGRHRQVVVNTKPYPMPLGIRADQFRFSSITLEVEQWSNGLIRSIRWHEVYSFGLVHINVEAVSNFSYCRKSNQNHQISDRKALFTTHNIIP